MFLALRQRCGKRGSEENPSHYYRRRTSLSAIGGRRALAIQRSCFTTKFLNDSLADGHHMTSEQKQFPERTARASGLTPLSIMPTHVASVSLSSCVFSNCEISNSAVVVSAARGQVQLDILSRVCWAAVMRSESLDDMVDTARSHEGVATLCQAFQSNTGLGNIGLGPAQVTKVPINDGS